MKQIRDSHGGQNVLARLEPLLAGGNSIQKRLAALMLEGPGTVAHLGVSEMAKQGNCSVGSVVKFAKSLGYQGYRELRIALAGAQGTGSIAAGMYGELQQADSPEEVAHKLFAAHLRCLDDTHRNLDITALTHLARAISSATTTHIYGAGNSGLVALDAEYKLMRIGLAARALTDSHRQLAFSTLLGPGDVALAISHSGRTGDVTRALSNARSAGAETAAITNDPDSPLARAADTVVLTSAFEPSWRGAAITSRITQLAIVDVLFAVVAFESYSQTLDCLSKTRAAVSVLRSDE